mmetsp:Transcript_106795/g.319282  ORF Transcript_106795/g.319282 Transcript_106795/m.319282 type:complete len:168 (-) Transcript_106795:415-918(-)
MLCLLALTGLGLAWLPAVAGACPASKRTGNGPATAAPSAAGGATGCALQAALWAPSVARVARAGGDAGPAGNSGGACTDGRGDACGNCGDSGEAAAASGAAGLPPASVAGPTAAAGTASGTERPAAVATVDSEEMTSPSCGMPFRASLLQEGLRLGGLKENALPKLQ